MNSTVWLALVLVLVLEGLGSMLCPKAWKEMIFAMTSSPDDILRCFGDGLMAADVVIYYMLRKTTD